MRAADAVILPQGCRESLYRLSRAHCRHVFPDYAMRFRYPGKTGQARLFREMAVPHPQTWVFDDLSHYHHCSGNEPLPAFPLVFKLDWGGEGETVALIRSHADLERALATAAAYERSGQRGFILQAFVPTFNRSLRVVVIGDDLTAYWRIQDQAALFGTSVAHGARIDHHADPLLREQGINLTRDFCRRAAINLAGFDLLFEAGPGGVNALFLEINYFFGRTGVGGSATFYARLQSAIDAWLAQRGLAVGKQSTEETA
ncbi:ATP-grasp domain-containing protein [Desulfosarcina cetonica]|uniref:ATP-grasp domain-containing protein n=1 Tax=Desulfosarcina cetonica TaxID=90730 RepID=UPI00155D9F06|nr:glutathione synthase [Desulfosarcina cetonica]